MTQWEVNFRNSVFCTARVLQINYHGKNLFLALRPQVDVGDGVSLDLQIGALSLRIGVENLSACTPFDERLGQLALEIYPKELQKVLLESTIDSLLTLLEGWLGGQATVEMIHLEPVPAKKSLPIQLSFALYEQNPHEDREVPLLLRGSLSMERALAERIQEALVGVDSVPYRHYECAVPRAISALASLEMAPKEVASLRVGDVVLLENSHEVNESIRELIGMAPYRIRCRQRGDKMTVLAIER
jgi:hypothetical protein